MGLGHREQPKISEESIRPLFVIALVVSLARPMKPPAHHRPQSTANKAVDGRERVMMRMLEVVKPSFQDGVERCNYTCERIPAGPLGPITDLVTQRLQTLPAYPALASFKPVSEELEALTCYPACTPQVL